MESVISTIDGFTYTPKYYLIVTCLKSAILFNQISTVKPCDEFFDGLKALSSA
jgi:hypothetical protein